MNCQGINVIVVHGPCRIQPNADSLQVRHGSVAGSCAISDTRGSGFPAWAVRVSGQRKDPTLRGASLSPILHLDFFRSPRTDWIAELLFSLAGPQRANVGHREVSCAIAVTVARA